MGYCKRLYTARALGSRAAHHLPLATLSPRWFFPGTDRVDRRLTPVGVAGIEAPPGGFPADDSPPWDEVPTPKPAPRLEELPAKSAGHPITHLEGSRPVGPRPPYGHGHRPLDGQLSFPFGE